MNTKASALRSLLTREVAPDGQPLFRSGAKLANAISESASADLYRNPKTTGALIGFVLRGERRCSEKLKDSILLAVRQRLSSKHLKDVQEDWIDRLSREIDAFNAEADDKQSSTSPRDEEQFRDLLRTAQSAKVHFVVTPLTAELQKGLEHAEQLTKILMQRFGLDREAPDHSTQKPKYVFLLPNEKTASAQWRQLIKDVAAISGAVTRAAIRRAYGKLKELDDQDLLCVYVVPSYVCGCPIVVFDPGEHYASAFSFGPHKEDVIDCIQWDDLSLRDWKENVYDKGELLDTKPAAEARLKGMLSESRSGAGLLDKFVGYRRRIPEVDEIIRTVEMMPLQ